MTPVFNTADLCTRIGEIADTCELHIVRIGFVQRL